MILWENKKALEETVANVRTSPLSDFYKNKFLSLPEDSATTLLNLPFLRRDELVETPPEKRLYIPKDEVAFVGYTSGTTSGKPLISYFSSIDNYFFEPSLGMTIERPLITYPPLNKNFGASFIQQCREAKQKVTPVFADYQNLPNSAVIARVTEIDSIYATPTIARLLGISIKEFYDPRRIKLLALSSETLTQSARDKLSKIYPNAKIANLYASSEIGQFILFPCPRMIEKNIFEFHFLNEALLGLEIIDGELVVTYALNKAFPLIRYRTGDFFEIGSEKCPCGRVGPTLRWSGRMDVDKLRIHGFEIRIEAIEDAFRSINYLISGNYQIHFYNDKNDKDKTRVEVEILEKEVGKFTAENIRQLVKRNLSRNWQIAPNVSFSQAIKKGVFSALNIILVKEFSHKSEKSKRLVNHLAN